jgi:hypothetical protein
VADLVQAREPFSVTLPNGVPFIVNKGDRIDSGDFVSTGGRESLFEQVTSRSSGFGANGRPLSEKRAEPEPPKAPETSETADAPPAAKRTVTRPRSGEDERPSDAHPGESAGEARRCVGPSTRTSAPSGR